jgi:CheY-like chemotaxis protein
MGYRADLVSIGLEALEALDRQSYDVVLMDDQMAEMGGVEATRQICSRWSRDQRPRVIAMTASAMPQDREACLAAGMDDYISKPVQAKELQIDRDVPEGLGIFDDDETISELFELFLQNTKERLPILRDAIARRDVGDVEKAAHELKGTSGSLGIRPMTQICTKRVEETRTGTLSDNALVMLSELEIEFDRVRQFLEREYCLKG